MDKLEYLMNYKQRLLHEIQLVDEEMRLLIHEKVNNYKVIDYGREGKQTREREQGSQLPGQGTVLGSEGVRDR